MAYADLHIHSTASDGTLSPEEIVRLCVENGVGALSVTDHDAVEGTLRAAPLARAAGLVYISGVEIDSLWRGRDGWIRGLPWSGSGWSSFGGTRTISLTPAAF